MLHAGSILRKQQKLGQYFGMGAHHHHHHLPETKAQESTSVWLSPSAGMMPLTHPLTIPNKHSMPTALQSKVCTQMRVPISAQAHLEPHIPVPTSVCWEHSHPFLLFIPPEAL